MMTDLQIILTMLAKTNADFKKDAWEKGAHITLSNEIQFTFNQDGSLWFISNERRL